MKAISRQIDRFCYKYPRFGIPNLIRYVVIITGIVFALSMMDTTNTLFPLLPFSGFQIFQGEIWRLITWVFLPFSTGFLSIDLGPAGVLLSLFITYMIGSYLEQMWGQAKLNLYFFSCMLTLVLAGLISHLLLRHLSIFQLFAADIAVLSLYLDFMLFFAFATLAPHTRFMLFFIIPVSAKMASFFSLAFLSYHFFELFQLLSFVAFLPLVLIIPYLLFCGSALQGGVNKPNFAQKKNAVQFKQAVRQVEKQQQARPHSRKCTTCGKTDTQYPDLEFRYCSRCNGYYCYCMEHINDHIHVVE